MIARHGEDRIAYWFQLILSMGIATYGLVLGSTGVVIGAMLVSPLMGPIVETGMGLVTGSPLLVIYAGARTLISVVVVVAASALLTYGVPYHELNAEILARTAPTLIDLYVASFCALAAAFTTVRQSSDTIAAAAGTAISIALVPPLCVIGWGFGSGHATVSRGAAMLFTANLCAILLFTVLVFFLLAYDTVDAAELETGAAAGTLSHRFASRIRRAFGSKYSPLLRLGMPLVLAVSIYVPLRRALEEVAWKVRTRDAVQHVLASVPAAKQAVRTTLSVEERAITVQLVIVGDQKAASKLKADLASRIMAATAIAPTIDVIALPDLEAVKVAMATNAPVVSPQRSMLPEVRKDLGEELDQWWPKQAAGDLASWSLTIADDSTPQVRVVHFGAPLGPAAEGMLAAALRPRLGANVSIEDGALPTELVSAPASESLEWLPKLTAIVNDMASSGVGYLCVTEPATPSQAKPEDSAEPTQAMVRAQLQRLPAERVSLEQGDEFSLRVSPEPCAPADRDGGADAADASPGG